MKKNEKIKLVIGAGGTGGHLFPASQIKEELEKNGYEVYLITDKRGERFANKFDKISVIIGGGLSGENLWYRIKSLTKLAVGFIQTLFYMIVINPKIVIGMGGYISVPVVIWAKILGKKTIIHNADSILGNANMLLAKFATVTAVSFEDTKKIPLRANVRFVGLPLRSDIKKIANTPYKILKQNSKIVICVMGGSQGAQIFSDIVPNAIEKLSNNIKKRLVVYQQVIEEDIRITKKLYVSNGVKAEIKSFFDNPAEILSISNIFIGRAGASTVLEVGTVGIPSIFIPIKHKDRQQVINAEKITRYGGGEIILQDDFSVDTLYKILKKFIETPNLLEKMAKKARIFEVKNNAAKNVVNLVDELLATKKDY